MIHRAKPIIDRETIESLEEVFKTGMLAQGPKVREFEKNFATYIGSKYAIATSSGTTALHMALLACEMKK